MSFGVGTERGGPPAIDLPKYRGLSRALSPLERDAGRRLVYVVESSAFAEDFAGPEGAAFSVPFDLWTFEEFAALAGMGAEEGAAFFRGPGSREGDPSGWLYLHPGGWQSWSPGWELAPGDTPPVRVRVIPDLGRQVWCAGDHAIPAAPVPDDSRGNPPPVSSPIPRKGWITGHFVMYFRRGEQYLCAASRDGGASPPVRFRIHRESRLVIAEVYAPGKKWKAGEILAELAVFNAAGYFGFKDVLRRFYDQKEPFRGTDFLLGPGERRPGGYESWYNHYTNINEALVLEDLDSLLATDNLVKRYYIDRGRPAVFQIDDGWEQAAGEWEIDTKRFPNGLAPVAERIEEAGLVPGLWIAPFIITKHSRIFRERPGWLLRDRNRKPVAAGWNNNWDGQYYCLDISRKDVQEYLHFLMDRAVNKWGFRYLKLDFLYAGLLPGVFAEGGSPAEHYEKAVSILSGITVNRAGKPVAYLGCGVPLGPSYRKFPLSRIGADTRETWDWPLAKWLLNHPGRPSALVSLRDTIGRSFMDGTVYINDPDVIFLRSVNCALTKNEKELVALVNFLLGGQIMFSDDPHLLGPEDLALGRRMVELFDRLGGDEYGAVMLDRDLYRLESRSGKIAGIINLGNRPWPLANLANFADAPRGESPSFGLARALAERPYIAGGIVDGRAGKCVPPRSITVV